MNLTPNQQRRVEAWKAQLARIDRNPDDESAYDVMLVVLLRLNSRLTFANVYDLMAHCQNEGTVRDFDFFMLKRAYDRATAERGREEWAQ